MIKHSIQEIIQNISQQPENSVLDNVEGLDEEVDFRECVDAYAQDLLSLIGFSRKQIISKMTEEEQVDSTRHALLLFLIFISKNGFIEFRNKEKRAARSLVMIFEKSLNKVKKNDNKKKA